MKNRSLEEKIDEAGGVLQMLRSSDLGHVIFP